MGDRLAVSNSGVLAGAESLILGPLRLQEPDWAAQSRGKVLRFQRLVGPLPQGPPLWSTPAVAFRSLWIQNPGLQRRLPYMGKQPPAPCAKASRTGLLL